MHCAALQLDGEPLMDERRLVLLFILVTAALVTTGALVMGSRRWTRPPAQQGLKGNGTYFGAMTLKSRA
jgi:hypothetical protein